MEEDMMLDTITSLAYDGLDCTSKPVKGDVYVITGVSPEMLGMVYEMVADDSESDLQPYLRKVMRQLASCDKSVQVAMMLGNISELVNIAARLSTDWNTTAYKSDDIGKRHNRS